MTIKCEYRVKVNKLIQNNIDRVVFEIIDKAVDDITCLDDFDFLYELQNYIWEKYKEAFEQKLIT